MIKLVKKELKFVTHQTSFIFLLLSMLVFVPNYPYYSIFFYTTLGIFFSCINARENNDLYFCMTLPISKQDYVIGKILTIILIQFLQVLLVVFSSVVKITLLQIPDNLVGIEANVAFIGFSLFLLGLFNAQFLPNYFENPNNIGKPYLIASASMIIFILFFETLIHLPFNFFKMLDSTEFKMFSIQLPIFLFGFLFYICASVFSINKSIENFKKFNI